MSDEVGSRRLPFRLVYHDGYDLNLGAHIFPSQKYRLIRERLLAEGIAESGDFVEPAAATFEQLTLVHDPDWIERLRNGTLTYLEIVRLEIPYTPRTVEAFFLAAGGTILACRFALKEGLGINLGGGFHHAFADHGEGFCAINDLAVAVRVLQKEGLIRKAMIVDCDAHQGNGTAFIFRNDPDVMTISIHQLNNYPAIKPPSTIDIHLEGCTGDERYLQLLRESYEPSLDSFRPDLILYVAGADPYQADQLGGLCLTMEGLKERDRLVLGLAVERGIPVAVTLAGGYAWKLEDTVAIHVNTVRVAAEVMRGNRGAGRQNFVAS